ncbi:MAG: hypothetical protein PUH36_05545 [Subdoligranulum sp.]|nr:hypothetical protein [Subdoligranulum sp.]MDD7265664.1 hypothetical protein [Subdoligranulum sp.]
MQAKLRCSAFAALLIAAGTALPHIWQVLRDYGLPAMGAPACSIRQFGLIPRAVTLSDVFLFWFLCRFAACLCMGWAVLWLGHRLGEMLPALFIGASALCLPALLCLSGMKNGIEWLGFYPLFHAASLLQIQGYNALGNEYSYSGFAFFWLAAALCFSWVLYWDLVYAYECKGQ